MNKLNKALIKVLLNVPQRIQILGFYKGIPILHDPKHPTPDNEVWIINENNLKIE